MPQTIRLRKDEAKIITKLSADINKQLVAMGLEPLTESKFIHAVLEAALPKVTLSEQGNVVITMGYHGKVRV